MSSTSKSKKTQTYLMSAPKMNFSQQRKQQNAEWAFATNSRNENGIVLCIPRVFKNITRERVFACMCNTGWGELSHVDLINCGSYQKAFVHFVPNGWSCGSEPEAVLRRLQAGQEVVFTYDVNDKHPEGWFWKISISKALNPKYRSRRVRRRQTVDLSGKMSATARAFVPQQVVNDDMLLQRKHQKPRSPRDDPIMARQLEHRAVMAVGYTNGSLELVEDGEILEEETYSKRIVQDFYSTEDRKGDESDEEEFSHLSEQAATFMEQKKKA